MRFGNGVLIRRHMDEISTTWIVQLQHYNIIRNPRLFPRAAMVFNYYCNIRVRTLYYTIRIEQLENRKLLRFLLIVKIYDFMSVICSATIIITVLKIHIK